MTGNNSLEVVIRNAASSWLPLIGGDIDFNTFDLYWHSGQVVRLSGVQIPQEALRSEVGVDLVELVEKVYFPPPDGATFREYSLDILVSKGNFLVGKIRDLRLLSFEDMQNYVVSLYTWHGCIYMAKLLRKTHRTTEGEAVYTDEMRLGGYKQLQVWWEDEDRRSNPWVRYGVSIARRFQQARTNTTPVDEWVPGDSPYWNC